MKPLFKPFVINVLLCALFCSFVWAQNKETPPQQAPYTGWDVFWADWAGTLKEYQSKRGLGGATLEPFDILKKYKAYFAQQFENENGAKALYQYALPYAQKIWNVLPAPQKAEYLKILEEWESIIVAEGDEWDGDYEANNYNPRSRKAWLYRRYRYDKIPTAVMLQLVRTAKKDFALPEGNFEVKYPNGQLSEKGTTQKGKLNGEYKRWFPNGKPAMLCQYNKGDVTGPFFIYNQNGQEVESYLYVDGRRETVFLYEYDELGRRTYSMNIFNNDHYLELFYGYRHNDDKTGFVFNERYLDLKEYTDGKNTVWYNNGKLREETYYSHGERTGHWKFYDQESNVTSEYKFSRDSLIHEIVYRRDANRKRETDCRVRRFLGHYIYRSEEFLLNENRIIKRMEYYPVGGKENPNEIIKHGVYEEFTHEGKPKISGYYYLDEPDSLWTLFDDNGKPRQTLQYYRGKIVSVGNLILPNGKTIEYPTAPCLLPLYNEDGVEEQTIYLSTTGYLFMEWDGDMYNDTLSSTNNSPLQLLLNLSGYKRLISEAALWKNAFTFCKPISESLVWAGEMKKLSPENPVCNGYYWATEYRKVRLDFSENAYQDFLKQGQAALKDSKENWPWIFFVYHPTKGTVENKALLKKMADQLNATPKAITPIREGGVSAWLAARILASNPKYSTRMFEYLEQLPQIVTYSDHADELLKNDLEFKAYFDHPRWKEIIARLEAL